MSPSGSMRKDIMAEPAPAPAPPGVDRVTPAGIHSPDRGPARGPDRGPGAGSDEPVHRHIERLEHRVTELVTALERTETKVEANTGRLVPAWRRVTNGERRLPVTVAVLSMIVLQAGLPERLSLSASWMLPVIEGGILVVLFASNPRRVTHASRWLRLLSLLLIAVASLANAWSAGRLILGLVHGTEGEDAGALLVTGGSIWLTNIVIFALWYWDLDRGGPSARACAERHKPDFLFPEMSAPELAEHDWEPQFVDYLYLAFTNATAFSPTDTLPFSRWSKLAMMLQSTISLTTGALVIARAVNILK
jgi:uncharacterized membrane protein